MKKPIIRQLKKIKGSNELVVCVPPEIREAIGSTEGDNLLFGRNPDSGIAEISKVVQSPNRQQNETRENAEDETRENESRVDLADEKGQSQQAEVSKFEFCTSCGSDDIRVTGNQFYCFECDVTYEVTPKGTKVVATNPVQAVNDLENRVEQLEQDMDGLNNKSSDDEDDEEPHGFIWFESENAHIAVGSGSDDDENLVPVGAEENPGSDDDDDESEQDGFLTW